MRNSTTDILRRQLGIITYMSVNFESDIAQVANHFGVSKLSIEKDLATLDDISESINQDIVEFMPVINDESHLTYLRPAGADYVLQLTNQELDLLLEVLSTADELTHSELIDELLVKIHKLRSSTVSILENKLDNLGKLRQMLGSSIVNFKYGGKVRKVFPLEIRLYQRNNTYNYYLHGLDVNKNDFRTYKVGLIKELELAYMLDLASKSEITTKIEHIKHENGCKTYDLFFKVQYKTSSDSIPYIDRIISENGDVKVRILVNDQQWFDQYLQENAYKLQKVHEVFVPHLCDKAQ
ncbi:hypothetical protein FACS1894125_5020 [Actinomycetota bacterium]|nr:hypothetical protein FACS1894125_5020 [Actinomycetota bacterium]